MAVFQYLPDQGAQRQVKPRVNANVFGGGYSQRVPEGINSLDETWQVSFTLRRRTEIQAMDDFLSSCAGATRFQWAAPNGVTMDMICDSWTPSYNHDGDCSMSATFTRVF